MQIIKKYLPELGVILFFLAISFVYFMPADTEGRILYRHDASAGAGSMAENEKYREQTGERPRWTNGIFSGMPTYQIAPSYESDSIINAALKVYRLFTEGAVSYVFLYLIGFYILMRAYDFRRELAVLGSIFWAFSSYFFIIIAAGHIFKVYALAYLPPLIAGIVMAYRGRLLPGMLLVGIFTAFEIKANHVQMTYYYLIPIGLLIIAFFYESVREKTLNLFAKATIAIAVAGIIGLATSTPNLYHTWSYAKESMRGQGELTDKHTKKQPTNGLDRDYITQWSYGIGETWTLLIPNAKGGASVPMSANKITREKADPNYLQIYDQIGQYWGEQPGTSGPVYVGAFVCFLFILGLFIVSGPIKWSLLAATVISILLSWGKNFMPLTDFFIDYVPMYAKFRTVASILVIAEFTMPLLAMLTLKKLIDRPETFIVRRMAVNVSLVLTIGVCALFYFMPGVFFDFVSSQEMQAMSQIPAEHLNPLLANLTSIRETIFTRDCARSILIIAIGAGLLLIYAKGKIRREYLVGALIVLTIADMWTINKRYLNDEMFVNASVRTQLPPMTDADKIISEDKDPNYRVLNLASNTFNESETSFYHHSIGGYHPAKLHRYQDLIDRHIVPEMQHLMAAVSTAGGDMSRIDGRQLFPILNMLNTRYFIFPLQDGKTTALRNPYAAGDAWFVQKTEYVDNADSEIDRIGHVDLRTTAVVDKRFADVIGKAVDDTTATIKLASYAPDRMVYDVHAPRGGVIVFSEVYYPGWKATIDGQEAQIGRADYILRALSVTPGHHKIEMTFDPESVTTTENIAWGASILLCLMAIGTILFIDRKQKYPGQPV